MLVRRLPVVALSVTFAAFGACNCDDDLYSFPGTLIGVVCASGNGQALANLPVTIVDAAGDEFEVTTDGTGLFKQEKVAAGTATITIHEAEGDREATVDIKAGREARFDDD